MSFVPTASGTWLTGGVVGSTRLIGRTRRSGVEEWKRLTERNPRVGRRSLGAGTAAPALQDTRVWRTLCGVCGRAGDTGRWRPVHVAVGGEDLWWWGRPRLCSLVPATRGPAMGTEQPSVPHSIARLSPQSRPLGLTMPVMEKLWEMIKRAWREMSGKWKVAKLLAHAPKKMQLKNAKSEPPCQSFSEQLQEIHSKFGCVNSPAKAAGHHCGPEEEQQVKQGKYRGLSGHNRSPHCTAHPPFLIPQRAAMPRWAQGTGSLCLRRCSSPWSACP